MNEDRTEQLARMGVNNKPFICAASMQAACADVFADEYALCQPLGEIPKWAPKLPKNPSILDIGANAGAFTVWANYAFEPTIVHAYEPHPEAWDHFCANVQTHGVPVVGHNTAVTDASDPKLWRGLKNLGESSLTRADGHRDDDAIAVEAVRPNRIPACHIVKVDTEGSEVEILRSLDLSVAELVLLEFHSAADEAEIRCLLTDAGFELFSGYWRNPSTGVLRFRRRHEENPNP